MKKFIIDKESAEKAKATISDTLAFKKWPKFENAVTENPFYHNKKDHIVYPLAAGTATDIPYKKKSQK